MMIAEDRNRRWAAPRALRVMVLALAVGAGMTEIGRAHV